MASQVFVGRRYAVGFRESSGFEVVIPNVEIYAVRLNTENELELDLHYDENEKSFKRIIVSTSRLAFIEEVR
jgi:hypothetical protein